MSPHDPNHLRLSVQLGQLVCAAPPPPGQLIEARRENSFAVGRRSCWTRFLISPHQLVEPDLECTPLRDDDALLKSYEAIAAAE